MASIIFDQETRTFSVVDETREFNENKPGVFKRVGKHISDNKKPYIGAASTVVAGTAGTLIAKKKAKAEADALGLEGAERKKYIRKKMLKGGAIGAGTGAVVGFGGAYGVDAISKHRKAKKAIADTMKKVAEEATQGNK